MFDEKLEEGVRIESEKLKREEGLCAHLKVKWVFSHVANVRKRSFFIRCLILGHFLFGPLKKGHPYKNLVEEDEEKRGKIVQNDPKVKNIFMIDLFLKTYLLVTLLACEVPFSILNTSHSPLFSTSLLLFSFNNQKTKI